MTITTKFDINQKVWFVCANTRKIKCERVKGINVIVTSKPVYKPELRKKELVPTGEYNQDFVLVYYHLESTSNEAENLLYATKEELLQSISQ